MQQRFTSRHGLFDGEPGSGPTRPAQLRGGAGSHQRRRQKDLRHHLQRPQHKFRRPSPPGGLSLPAGEEEMVAGRRHRA